jgi:O-antigen/teichoic acid export membrane protein
MIENALPWSAARPGRSIVGTLVAAIDRDIVTTLVVRLAIVAGGLLSSVLTARWLSPSGRGEYFLVVTLAQLLAQFGNLGLQSSNTYLVARNRSLTGSLLANSLWISILVGGLGSAAAILFSHGATGGRIWLAAALAPATLFFMLGTNLLVGLKRISAFNAFQFASNFGVLICLGAAAALGAGPTGFLIASSGGWALVSLALVITLARGADRRIGFDTAVFTDGFRYALKAYVATACGFLIVRSNVFLLGGLVGTEQVGYYSVATQIADVIGILPQSIALVLFPTLITAKTGQFRATLRQLAMVGVLLAVGCAVVALFADPFLRLVFGPRFLPAVPILRWMLPSAFFLGLTSVQSQYLAARGFPSSLVSLWVGGGVAAVVFGRVLIPSGSGVGAAIALSATHAAMFAGVFALSLLTARREALRAVALVEQGACS